MINKIIYFKQLTGKHFAFIALSTEVKIIRT